MKRLRTESILRKAKNPKKVNGICPASQKKKQNHEGVFKVTEWAESFSRLVISTYFVGYFFL